MIASFRIEPSIIEQIRQAQKEDSKLVELTSPTEPNGNFDFGVSDDGLIRFKGRICVPNDDALKRQILDEAHSSKYTMHPGSTKMYQNLRQVYWWPGMKKEIA